MSLRTKTLISILFAAALSACGGLEDTEPLDAEISESLDTDLAEGESDVGSVEQGVLKKGVQRHPQCTRDTFATARCDGASHAFLDCRWRRSAGLYSTKRIRCNRCSPNISFVTCR